MKKVASLLVICIVFSLLCPAVSADTFRGTKVRSSNADPNLFFYNGKYYLTQTGTSQIAVFEEDTLTEISAANINNNIEYKGYKNNIVYDNTITTLFGSGATINGTWSPEIHYFSRDDFPDHPEYEGWYLLLGLRKTYIVNGSENSSYVRLVVLKSTSGTPKGPYGHPVTGALNQSQPLLNASGNIHNEWACGQTILRIPEGEYAGLYGMWVSEEGRGAPNGGKYGDFYQKIMIAKMQSPWQLSSEVGIVTTPTQQWEYAGASTTHPRVVEGATPVYGKNGEVFITYSGSGYWSDYGLGQLTWNGEDPLKTTSWVKYENNPIFTAKTADNLRGAGHASFLTDTSGNGFFCYHAYAYENGKKASGRDAYIEPYYIDYTADNGVGKGVLRLGLNKNGVAANTSSTVTFDTSGNYLTEPSIKAVADKYVTLTLSEKDADGYLIYRSTDGEVFDYVTTVDGDEYVDTNVLYYTTYYYRAYAYREEEISDVSATVSAKPNRTLLDGDVSGDNRISLVDVLRILRYTTDESIEISISSADTNGDGSVTVHDALLLFRLYLNG